MGRAKGSFLVHRASPSFRSRWQGGTFLDTKQTFTRAQERAILCNKHTHTHTHRRERKHSKEGICDLSHPISFKRFFFFFLLANTLQNNHYRPGGAAGIVWCVGGPEHHTQSRPTSLGEYNYETFKPPLRSHISMSPPLLLPFFFFLPIQTGKEEILTTPTGLCVGFFFFHPSPTFGMGCVVVACLSHFSV